jgi:hypothetical protein
LSAEFEVCAQADGRGDLLIVASGFGLGLLFGSGGVDVFTNAIGVDKPVGDFGGSGNCGEGDGCSLTAHRVHCPVERFWSDACFLASRKTSADVRLVALVGIAAAYGA